MKVSSQKWPPFCLRFNVLSTSCKMYAWFCCASFYYEDFNLVPEAGISDRDKLEQIERLHSEITPPPPAPWLPILVIHIRWKEDKVKVKKIAKNSNFARTLHAAHVPKLLDKMYKYEMDPSRTVGATERTRDAGRTDGVKPIYPPTTLLCGGYNNCIPQYSVGCNYLLLPKIPASGTKVFIS